MKCINSGCNSKREKGRRLCSKCIKRKYREKYPIKTSYQILRDNAKRRGKEFKLTFEEFKGLCEDSGYIEGKGIYKDCLTIDRKDPLQGYEIGNLEVIKQIENSIKGAIDDKMVHRMVNYVEGIGVIGEKVPF